MKRYFEFDVEQARAAEEFIGFYLQICLLSPNAYKSKKFLEDLSEQLKESSTAKGKHKKKAMICQPMRDKTEQEIKEARKQGEVYLTEQGYQVINTYFPKELGNMIKHNQLFYLAKSIESMAGCDVVYFTKGWEEARGCRMEYSAAKHYGLTILEEV